MIDKINGYVGVLIGILVIVYMFYRLFYGLVYKMGGHKKIEEFNNELKIKNFESKEKEKLSSYYQNKVLSVSDLLLIAEEDLEEKLKDNDDNFYLEIKIGEQYNGLIKCYLTLEKLSEDEKYIVKNVDIKDMKNITDWQNN